MKIDTKCIHSGYTPQNGEPRVMPLVQSTTYRYDNADTIGQIFDLEASGFFYSRLSNPTVDAMEKKIAELEGGIAAIATSSGQAAVTLAVTNILNAGDHILCSSAVYGGTFNLFNVTLRRMGYDVTFVSPDASFEEIDAAVKPNTRCVFGEMLSNPSMCILDLDKFSKIAKKHNVPFIVDNTFPTPINCRPLEHGADIVIHSTTKYLDGHAVALGGIVVDSGNYDWSNGVFKDLCTPDPSYHGSVFTELFGKAAYIARARLHIMRDMGMAQSPMNAFLTNLGMETLHLRMKRHNESADKLAHYLQKQDKVEMVYYPTLEGNKYNALAKKYLPNGCSGVIAFNIKGGKQKAIDFMKNLKLISICTHVADLRSYMLHPAGTTHRQMDDASLNALGIAPNMIRFSVGLEDVDDLIADIDNALKAI